MSGAIGAGGDCDGWLVVGMCTYLSHCTEVSASGSRIANSSPKWPAGSWCSIRRHCRYRRSLVPMLR